MNHPPSYSHNYSGAAGGAMPRCGHDSTPKRYASTGSHHHNQPWHQMASTYAWVDAHDNHTHHDKHSRKTEQWVLEQRVYFNNGQPKLARTKTQPQQTWEEMVYAYEVEADEWARREAEIRRKVMQRELEKARLIREEMRRTEERIRMKREAERQKVAEAWAKVYLEKREREKRERVKLDKAMVDAWTNYEARWAEMQASSDPLMFSNIPWPQLSTPDAPAKMSPADIASFLLSPLHSQQQTRKERIRCAQLRWHPDRFGRFMSRVVERDRAMAEEAVGMVARCLNDLMAAEVSINSC